MLTLEVERSHQSLLIWLVEKILVKIKRRETNNLNPDRIQSQSQNPDQNQIDLC